MSNVTIDWCEANYVVMPWIAEFWNTLTSMCCIVPPIIWFLQPAPRNAGIIPWMHVLLVVIFVGSAAFHGTLTWTGQLLDEVPILIFAACSLCVLVDNTSIQMVEKGFRQPEAFVARAWWSPGPKCLAAFCLVEVLCITYLYVAQHKVYVVFLGFVIIQAALHWPLIIWDLHWRWSCNRTMCMLLAKHVALGYSAYGLWCLENAFCERLRHINLHAMWHVLATLSMKPYVDFLIFWRLLALGEAPRYRMVAGGFGACVSSQAE